MKFKSIPQWIVYTLVVIAALGFVDATYLTINHYENAIPPCFIGSCEQVLTSSYSMVLGIPDAAYGVAYYLFIFVCLVIYIESKDESKKHCVLAIALWVTIAGFLTSLYLFYLQAFVIHAFCQYCLGSATTSTILFIIAMCVLVKFRVSDSDMDYQKKM